MFGNVSSLPGIILILWKWFCLLCWMGGVLEDLEVLKIYSGKMFVFLV
jgi:hypothetical protein